MTIKLRQPQLFRVSSVDKNWLLLGFVVLVFGCVQTTTDVSEETELRVFEGLGATYFGTPTFGGQTPAFSTQIVRPNEEAYISLILRNNIEGETAENVVISLDNVEPFKISECGVEHDPAELRIEESNCITWFDTLGYNYKTFSIPSVTPGEEVETIYVLKAPAADQIANVYYEQDIFYNIQYQYRTSMFQSLLGMSQDEYRTRLSLGTQISGSQSNTAGAISIKQKTTTPVIYSLDVEKAFSVEYDLSNNGEGIVQPGSKLRVTFTYPNNIKLSPTQAASDEWYDLSKCEEENVEACKWFTDAYGAELIDRTLYLEVDATNLVTKKTLVLSFILEDTNSPFTSIPLISRVDYVYTISGSTKIGVSPVK